LGPYPSLIGTSIVLVPFPTVTSRRSITPSRSMVSRPVASRTLVLSNSRAVSPTSYLGLSAMMSKRSLSSACQEASPSPQVHSSLALAVAFPASSFPSTITKYSPGEGGAKRTSAGAPAGMAIACRSTSGSFFSQR
jgi:hypothetical protein